MVRVRRSVVEVAGEQASIRTIVPIAADVSDNASGMFPVKIESWPDFTNNNFV